MDATPARRLTKLSFRRDVRLFFRALVGFLAALIVLLLVLLQSFMEQTVEAVELGRQRIANMAAAELSTGLDLSAASLQLNVMRTRYELAGIVVATPQGGRLTSGALPDAPHVAPVTRPTAAGTLTLLFDNTRLDAMRRTFQLTALISLLAVAAGVLLLSLYLPRITGPIEQMLDSAARISEREPGVDEQQYLIETFRASIDTLKEQQEELRGLHDAQKIRADDLERVTAALTRSLTSGFVAVDPEGRVVDLNLAARDILRTGDASLSGVELAAAFGDNAFSRAVADAVTHREAMARSEVTIEREPGEQLIGLTTVPLVDAEQTFLGLLALFTDLTPFRDLETRVRELQNLADLGEISAGIAHEFRNALSTILGYLKLARRAPSIEDAGRAIEKSEREASLLSAAVDRLLAFARPMHIEWQRVDLLQLAGDVCERVPAAEVAVTCGGDAAEIDGDPALLARAVENLVRNAIDSVREQGSGAVRVIVRGGAVPHLRVEDDGAGLEPEDVPRLLLPFQSTKPTGYGLGLPLTRKIVLLHGGTLRLTGRRGAGAVASIDFPARPAQS